MTLVHQPTEQSAAPPAPSTRSSKWPAVAAVAAVAVPTALLGLHALAYGRWIVDDAAITFAYARSVATGEGPVLQPGADPVEGWSNPVWLGLLVLARWLGLFDRGAWFGVPDYVAFPKLLALVCGAALFGCYYAVARATTTRPALVTILAGAVTAAVPSFVVWTMSGLENGLLALAVAAMAAVLARAAVTDRLLGFGVAVSCGLLAALAALTRPDGLVYAGAYPLVVLLFAARGRLGRAVAAATIGTATFAVPVGAYLWWRVVTFGEYLPNTARAKAQGLPGLVDLARPVELAEHTGWLAAVLAILLVGAALARQWPGRAGLLVLLVPLGLALAAYAVLEPDWMGLYRFATPVWVLGTLAATVAAANVLPMLAARGRTAVAVVTVAAAALSVAMFIESGNQFRTAPTAPLCLVAQNAGRNFAGYADAIGRSEATLLAPDIGGAALTSPIGLLDLAGLADARIAGYWHDRDFEGLRDYVFEQARPTFIKGHSPWSTSTGLAADPRLDTDYAQIGSVSGTTDWVRRDALPDPAALERLREHFATVAGPADDAARRSPRGSCGDRLRVDD